MTSKILKKQKQNIYFEILLHDIRSVQNVASIFRLADCIGASKVILSGITPGSKDRFDREREDFVKISLGSEKTIQIERVGEEMQNSNFKNEIDKENLKKILKYIKIFRENGGMVIALEQDENSLDYKKVGEIVKEKVNNKYLIIPGREVEGLDGEILKSVDIIGEIGQYGQKESLNIFSSLAIVLYRWFDI